MRLSGLHKWYSMSLPAMSLGDWFFVSRKGGTGGGGLVHQEGEKSMAMSGLGYENPLVGPLISLILRLRVHVHE